MALPHLRKAQMVYISGIEQHSFPIGNINVALQGQAYDIVATPVPQKVALEPETVAQLH